MKLTQARVFVRGIEVAAHIGIHGHEQGRTQPLIIDVEVTIASDGFEHIADTLNYETITRDAHAVAAKATCLLVETYAERLASSRAGRTAGADACGCGSKNQRRSRPTPRRRAWSWCWRRIQTPVLPRYETEEGDHEVVGRKAAGAVRGPSPSGPLGHLPHAARRGDLRA